MMKERIGIFGGTFNPIHWGHLKAAEVVQRMVRLEKVLFIPSYIPPRYQKRMVEISESEEVRDNTLLSFKIFLFPSISLDVSSTEVRERIKRGDSIKGMVSEAVESYIYQKNIYRDKNG